MSLTQSWGTVTWIVGFFLLAVVAIWIIWLVSPKTGDARRK